MGSGVVFDRDEGTFLVAELAHPLVGRVVGISVSFFEGVFGLNKPSVSEHVFHWTLRSEDCHGRWSSANRQSLTFRSRDGLQKALGRIFQTPTALDSKMKLFQLALL